MNTEEYLVLFLYVCVSDETKSRYWASYFEITRDFSTEFLL